MYYKCAYQKCEFHFFKARQMIRLLGLETSTVLRTLYSLVYVTEILYLSIKRWHLKNYKNKRTMAALFEMFCTVSVQWCSFYIWTFHCRLLTSVVHSLVSIAAPSKILNADLYVYLLSSCMHMYLALPLMHIRTFHCPLCPFVPSILLYVHLFISLSICPSAPPVVFCVHLYLPLSWKHICTFHCFLCPSVPSLTVL